jgi:NAD(P)-dependent dehydrogenase (short-subunit alcohol dehydrogenase family)
MSPKPTAIVTGASGGTGSGLVEAFQRQLRLKDWHRAVGAGI